MTRNLVIRFVKPEMTAESICADVEHIHQCEVVGLRFELGHAFLSLSSIQSATHARSCFLSRLKYKGTRIEFYPDECDQPLPEASQPMHVSKPTKASKPNQLAHSKGYATTNPFSLLDYSATSEDEDSWWS